MKSIGLLFLLVTAFVRIHAQDKTLPYYEIPSPPENFSAGTIAARMVDGVGFRYYWATAGLSAADLSFKPSKEARTSEETLTHIYELSTMIVNATSHTPNQDNVAEEKLPFSEIRKRTLENLKVAANRLRTSSDATMKAYKVIFKTNNENAEFPFWNLINGPIADCLWHIGQVVSFRRSSGNPFSEKVNVFAGKLEQ